MSAVCPSRWKWGNPSSRRAISVSIISTRRFRNPSNGSYHSRSQWVWGTIVTWFLSMPGVSHEGGQRAAIGRAGWVHPCTRNPTGDAAPSGRPSPEPPTMDLDARGSDREDRQADARPAEARASPRRAGPAPGLGCREPTGAPGLRREAARGEPPPGPAVPARRALLRGARGLGDGVEAGPGHARGRVLQGTVAARRRVDPPPPGEPHRPRGSRHTVVPADRPAVNPSNLAARPHPASLGFRVT